MVAAGRVAVNGVRAEPGTRVGPGDRVTLDGRRLASSRAFGSESEVLVYHKPVGVVCTRSDPEGRPTMFDDLPKSRRWVSVGRLDLNSSGLMLVTNDGELANRLMHPRYGVEREYLVRVRGELDRDSRRRLESGVEIDGRTAAVSSVTVVRGAGRDGVAGPEGEAPPGPGHAWYRVVIREGRNREVRRLFEAVGHKVARLKRIRYGPITMPRELGPGRFRALEADELAALTAAPEGTAPPVRTRGARGAAAGKPRARRGEGGRRR